MAAILHVIISALCILPIITLLFVPVSAIELDSINAATNNFTKDLKSKISNLITNALNDTNISNTTLTNESNLTSSQVIISKNKVVSTITSNGSDGNSKIKDKVTTINGVCSSEKVGGNGNDTLASSGDCNDELTGGLGADKFMCGEGNDTIRDYNSKEGDTLLDKQNCEKIL